eukprot:3032946-Pyramimonas_sp.AAC.1
MPYEFLCGPGQAPVVQQLVDAHADFAAQRKAVQHYYERGVTEAVFRRWKSEHYAPDAEGRPVRGVWKDHSYAMLWYAMLLCTMVSSLVVNLCYAIVLCAMLCHAM